MVLALLALSAAGAATLEPYRIVTDVIPEPLGGFVGEVARGAALVKDRERGNCLICHHGEDPAEPFQGAIGPPLRGVGLRLSAGQIRLRMVDMSRLDPATVMPPYYRTENLSDVAEAYRGQPALTAQEIEDVVSYLATLKAE